MKKLIMTILAIGVLTACDHETKTVKDATFVSMEKNSDSFMTVNFKTKSGKKVEYSAHVMYEKNFIEGEAYDFIYVTEDQLLRPDKEIIRLNPFDQGPLDQARE